MLTSDLVRVRRKGSELSTVPLPPRVRDVALQVGGRYLELTELGVGRTRRAWERALASVQVSARDRKLAAGLRKLVEDRCTFEPDAGAPPAELREEVFRLASRQRQELESGQRLDREAVLAQVAAARELTVEDLERRLYGDLKQARRLQTFAPVTAEELVDRYEQGQAQAVLLKATRVTVTLHSTGSAALRRLFHKLKFLRLLHTLSPLPGGGHRLELDGPLSLFGPSTKYGVKLAMLLPALDRAGPFTLDADVLWGKGRERCTFHLEREGSAGRAGDDSTARDEVTTLQERLRKLDSGWSIRKSTRILELPGLGLCVPDLVFTRDGRRVYLEVMGWWSRDAVWRRVELVEGGLKDRVLFCVSSRLRVSEEALGDEHPGSLYVFKGVMSAREVLAKIEALADYRRQNDG